MSRADEAMPDSVADLAALGQLLEEHRARLLGAIRHRLDPALGARIDAEDVLAETFLAARRKWARYKEQPAVTPYAWLYRIALDCLIEAWRTHQRGPRDLHLEMPWPEHSSVQLGLGLVSPGTSPSEATARAELRLHMRQALAMLKETDREVLWMRHYDGLSFKELASVLDMQESAATLRYVRALDRLRRLWQRLHP